jgi:hypothetical protein
VIDLTANYVYFYEIVNQTSGVSLEKFNVFSGSTPYTSAGFLFQTVFSDSTGAVGPAGNQYLGLNPGATPAGDTLDGQPTQSGVAAPGFATNLSATAPSSADLGGAGTGGFASFFFDTPRISPSGGFSTVVFLTSNAPPVYARGDIRDGGDPAVGDIPVQAPEPAGLLLQVIGIGALGGMYGWRRWRGSALPSLA